MIPMRRNNYVLHGFIELAAEAGRAVADVLRTSRTRVLRQRLQQPRHRLLPLARPLGHSLGGCWRCRVCRVWRHHGRRRPQRPSPACPSCCRRHGVRCYRQPGGYFGSDMQCGGACCRNSKCTQIEKCFREAAPRLAPASSPLTSPALLQQPLSPAIMSDAAAPLPCES